MPPGARSLAPQIRRGMYLRSVKGTLAYLGEMLRLPAATPQPIPFSIRPDQDLSAPIGVYCDAEDHVAAFQAGTDHAVGPDAAPGPAPPLTAVNAMTEGPICPGAEPRALLGTIQRRWHGPCVYSTETRMGISEAAVSAAPSRHRQPALLRPGAAWVFLALAAVGLFLRVWHIDWIPGLNGDEAWYGIVARHIVSGQGVPAFTPNRNFLNPFFMAPQLLFAVALPPGVATLRAVSVLAGIATIAVAIAAVWSVSRNRTAAMTAGLVIACLPVTIAYARFGWDTSMSVGAGIIVLWAAARWSDAALGLALYAAILVHPTNMLLAPAAAVFMLLHDRPLRAAATRLAVLAIVAGTFLAVSPGISDVRNGQINASRLADPSAWVSLVSGFSRLLFGPTVYDYIASGTGPGWAWTCDSVLGPALVAVLLASLVHALAVRDREGMVLAGAVVATLVCALATVGNDIFRPGIERYSLFTLPPTVFWIAGLAKRFNGARVAAVAVSSVLLVTFYLNYFMPYLATGGASDRTFRTADPEPKAGAVAQVAAMLAGRDDTTIFVDDYWLEQPFLYFGTSWRPERVVQMDQANLSPDRIAAELAKGTIFVSFAGSPWQTAVLSVPGATIRATLTDRSGKPLIVISGSR